MSRKDDNTDFYEGSDLEALATLHRYQRWIVDNFRPYLHGQAIEFGAGIGNISSLIHPHVSQLDLVEPSPNLVKALRQRFKEDGHVSIIPKSLEESLGEIDDEAYDVVMLVNVLEHIENDQHALGELHRILKPGGHLLLFVPALRFLYSKLDRQVGHFRRYHKPDLNQRVSDAGLIILHSQYFDILGVFPWWILNKLMGATGFNPTMANVYDAVFAPLSRGIERVITPPFGKNLLQISQRPRS